MSSNPTIRKILSILRGRQFEQFGSRAKVFGSVAHGSKTPGDIDIMLDYTDYQGVDALPPDEADIFLALARKFYGYVDVFVKVRQVLYVRSDDCTHWIVAKNAKKIWANSQTDGKPVSDVVINEVAMKSFKEYLEQVLSENATAGATSAASIAVAPPKGSGAGAIGVGFDPNGHKGIYEPAAKAKKSKAAPVIKR